jgi:hypothetical protein
MESSEQDQIDRGQDLHAAFVRAARAIGNAPSDPHHPDDLGDQLPGEHEVADIRALRSDVRGAAAAYARRLRDEGVTPERMLVLVKATTDSVRTGLGVRELTNDIVRWSIEAYFAD